MPVNMIQGGFFLANLVENLGGSFLEKEEEEE